MCYCRSVRPSHAPLRVTSAVTSRVTSKLIDMSDVVTLNDTEGPRTIQETSTPVVASRGKRFLIWLTYSTLLFLTYLLIGAIVTAGIELVSGPPANRFTDLLRLAWAAFLGAAAAMEVLFLFAKNNSVRGAVVAFIAWFAANYAVHYIFFTWQTDFIIVGQTIQSAVACVTVWTMFLWKKMNRPSQISN